MDEKLEVQTKNYKFKFSQLGTDIDPEALTDIPSLELNGIDVELQKIAKIQTYFGSLLVLQQSAASAARDRRDSLLSSLGSKYRTTMQASGQKVTEAGILEVVKLDAGYQRELKDMRDIELESELLNKLVMGLSSKMTALVTISANLRKEQA